MKNKKEFKELQKLYEEAMFGWKKAADNLEISNLFIIWSYIFGIICGIIIGSVLK